MIERRVPSDKAWNVRSRLEADCIVSWLYSFPAIAASRTGRLECRYPRILGRRSADPMPLREQGGVDEKQRREDADQDAGEPHAALAQQPQAHECRKAHQYEAVHRIGNAQGDIGQHERAEGIQRYGESQTPKRPDRQGQKDKEAGAITPVEMPERTERRCSDQPVQKCSAMPSLLTVGERQRMAEADTEKGHIKQQAGCCESAA